jgi:tRNA-specific 2-thiouridylase
VPRKRFDRVLFPLGALTKEAVRACARRAGLPVHAKPDSTGICFIGERPFAEFLKTYVSENPGPIETRRGECIGTHRGLPFYTLGQRAGLQIGGHRGAAEEPWYVARKIHERNALIVVQRHEHEALESLALRTESPNWLIAEPPREFRAGVKVRYRQTDQPALIRIQDDGTLHIRFDTPQRAVTPGQSAVLYQGPRCLGGAVITDTLESDCP